MTEHGDKVEVPAWRKLVPPLLELGPLLVFFLTNGNCQRLFDYCLDEKRACSPAPPCS